VDLTLAPSFRVFRKVHGVPGGGPILIMPGETVLGITRERLRLGPLAVHSDTAICQFMFQKLEGTESYAGRFAGHTEDSFRAARSTPTNRPQPSRRSQVAASRAAFSWPCR
jgi:dCTP deaminase